MDPFEGFVLFTERERSTAITNYIQSIVQPFNAIPSTKNTNLETVELLKDIFAALSNSNIALLKTALESFCNSTFQEKHPSHVNSFPQIFKSALLAQLSYFTNEPQTLFFIHQKLDDLFVQLFSYKTTISDNQQQIFDPYPNNEETYKDFFDNAHDLMHIAEPDGTILYVNKAWQKTLGYSLEEIKGQSIYFFVNESDLDAFRNYRNNILKGINITEKITVHLKTKNLKKVAVEGFISVKTKNNIPQYTRGVFVDITSRNEKEIELKNIYAQLKERKENLSHLVTNAPDAIIVIDAASIITYWNPKAEVIFGWKAEEVEGKQLSDLIIPLIYREAHHKGMKRFLTTGEASVLNKTISVTAINKKGEELSISLTISKGRQSGKDVFISFIRDTTEEKKMELELARKRKELEESNRELEQYSWLTSHDLREPLRKIMTFSDMLINQQKEHLSPQVEKNAYKIYDAAQRMNHLIQAVLSYSEATQKHSLFEKTDLNKILEEVQTDLELLIENSKTKIEADNLPVIESIPFQMRQLFQNLISNSIKYCQPDVTPHIHISSTQQDGMVQIFVKDNGRGFSLQNKEKVFRLFQRLETAVKIEGMGIGLAICKKIVEQHHGFIEVDSTPNVGTTFIVGLPVTQKIH